MLLHLTGVDGLALSIDPWSDHVGALVHVGKQQRGADARLGVEPRTPVTVPASADLEVEWAVNSVLLRPEY